MDRLGWLLTAGRAAFSQLPIDCSPRPSIHLRQPWSTISAAQGDGGTDGPEGRQGGRGRERHRAAREAAYVLGRLTTDQSEARFRRELL
jgi:hypothetical protein